MTDASEPFDVFQEDPPTAAVGGEDLVDFVSMPVVVADSSGKVRLANPSLLALVGRPADVVLGRLVADLFEPASQETVARLLETVHKLGRSVEVELHLATASGSAIVRGAAAGRFETSGELREVVWSLRRPDPVPVSGGGVRAEWLAATLGDVTSDFTSLAAVFEDGLRKAAFCLESTPGWTVDPSLKGTHARLNETLSGLRRFAEEMASLNQLVADRPVSSQAVDPSGCLERAARVVARSLRASRVRLRNDIPEPPPMVWGDPDRLTEVFLLLLVSSRDILRRTQDASGDDSTVSRKRTIQVETGLLPPWVQLLVTNNARAVLPGPIDDFRPLGRSTLNRSGLRGMAEAAEILRALGGSLVYQPVGETGNRCILTLRQA